MLDRYNPFLRNAHVVVNYRAFFLIALFFIFNLTGCVNLQYVESLGDTGQTWSQDSMHYIDVAEQAHNTAYQYNKAIIDSPPKCKQGFRLCLRAWERNDKETRFNFLRSVASLMLVYTQTLKSMASDVPLEELKRLSKKVGEKLKATHVAYTQYREVVRDEQIASMDKFDLIGDVVYGISRIHFDYQRDKAIRILVKKRYEDINRTLVLYSRAISALIDSTQVIAGDLHGDFENFVQASWKKASETERLYIMQQSVFMKELQSKARLEKVCPPDISGQCNSSKNMLQYKLILELEALMAAHNKLYFAAKSDLPLDFKDFSETVKRLSKF